MASEPMTSPVDRATTQRPIDRVALCAAVLAALFLLAWIQPPLLKVAYAVFGALQYGSIALFPLDLMPQFNGMLFGVALIVFALPLLVMAVADIRPRTQVLLLLCATCVMSVLAGGFAMMYGNLLIALVLAVVMFVAVALPLVVTLGALRAIQSLVSQRSRASGVRTPEASARRSDA